MKIKLKKQFYFIPLSISETFQDCFFIGCVVALSCILYIGNLGFYSDDFGFLLRFSQISEQPLLEIFSSAYLNNPNFWMRPVEPIYKIGQYFLFGFHPVGYHLVNSTILIIGFIIFYLVLRELQQKRLLAFSTAIVYAALPHYSSNRLWYTASMISLSMTLYFLSFYALLKALKSKSSVSFWLWNLLGIMSMLISLLSYELFLPLFLFNIGVIWFSSRKILSDFDTPLSRQSKPLIIALSNLFAWLVATFLKYLVSYPSGKLRSEIVSCMAQGREDCKQINDLANIRLTGLSGKVAKILSLFSNNPILIFSFVLILILLVVSRRFLRDRWARLINLSKKVKIKWVLYSLLTLVSIYIVNQIRSYLTSLDDSTSLIAVALSWWGKLARATIQISYIDYGLRLPQVSWQVITNYPSLKIFILGVILGLSIAWYLLKNFPEKNKITRVDGFRLFFSGFIVFVLGYAMFLTNKKIVLTAAGLGNRTAMASTVGVALTLVGGIVLVTLLPMLKHWRKTVFCTLIVLICTSGILINNTVASLWVKAHMEQQEILSAIAQDIPFLDKNTTLLIDGICPYIGPAPVFEGGGDIRSALHLLYQNPTLNADVVKPRMKVKEEGIVTRIYGKERVYPYQNLAIYHVSKEIYMPLIDAETAKDYFQKFNPEFNSYCPSSYEGAGTPIFR